MEISIFRDTTKNLKSRNLKNHSKTISDDEEP